MGFGKASYFLAGVIVASFFWIGFSGSEPVNKLENFISTSSSGEKVSLRDIKQNPVKYEGEVVTVEGGSNSFADFIKSDGYTLPLDCSDYPDFRYSSQFSVEVVVELEDPGESGPELRCVSAPKMVG